MGASVSSMQILGVPEDTVRAALPGALVGTWSKRFVTACLGPDFMETERKARSLSKKLQCTVLAVSLIDGDTLRLMLYQSGKNLTYHIALPKYGTHKAGNSALFCSVLGLPEALAPKLKRLLAGCEIQEEKLGILQALLGAPLLIHCGEIPGEAVKEDSGPLENWIRERPAPLKIKNRYKAELIQEIPDRHPEFTLALRSGTLILRPAVRGEDQNCEYVIERAGDILGYACAGGEWARPLPDGRLELVPLADPDTADRFDTYLYAQSKDRLVTAAVLHGPDPSGFPGAYKPTQTVIVHDTAGILPCPLPLTLENSPATGTFTLLPDGGFLAEICPKFDSSRPPVQIQKPALACYGPDGTQRWTAEGSDSRKDASALLWKTTTDTPNVCWFWTWTALLWSGHLMPPVWMPLVKVPLPFPTQRPQMARETCGCVLAAIFPATPRSWSASPGTGSRGRSVRSTGTRPGRCAPSPSNPANTSSASIVFVIPLQTNHKY